MSDIKPIKLYSHASGPNPWKVAIILEELGLPYDTEYVDMAKIKQEPYISINPNGRVPAIEDPNTGYTIWESGACIQYLIAEYDKDHKLSYATKPEKYHTDQWLFFQVSGQGPYFGQLAWFKRFHPEKLPSAIERYEKEVDRVVSVIDAHLTKTGKPYLVGDRCTYADLSFITWAGLVGYFGVDIYEGGKNEKYKEWLERITGREAVKKVFAEKERVGKAGH